MISRVQGFRGGSDSKESSCNMGELGSTPGLGRFPGGGHGNPLQYSCLENPKDRGAYSPWGQKEADTAEQLSISRVQSELRDIVGLVPDNHNKVILQ